jgi:hypothetical protein
MTPNPGDTWTEVTRKNLQNTQNYSNHHLKEQEEVTPIPSPKDREVLKPIKNKAITYQITEQNHVSLQLSLNAIRAYPRPITSEFTQKLSLNS